MNIPRWILASAFEQIAVANNADDGPGTGRLEVFGYDSNYEVWHTWQTDERDDDAWGGNAQRGGYVNQLQAAVNADGRIELFALGVDDRAVYHDWQTLPGWFF
jgi:hypothetical protein